MHVRSFVHRLCPPGFRLSMFLAIVVAILDALGVFSPARGQGVSSPGVPQSFAIRDVRMFDGARVVAATDVIVRDGRIAAVGRRLAIPKGLTVIDGRGRTLLPGLIDAHVHTFGQARRDAIRFGVTSELDMFSDWHQIAAAKATRESVAPTPLADLWSAGTLATAPEGHGTEYGFPIPTLTSPAEADAFVKARLAEGSDYLKIILEDGSAYGHPIPTLDAPTTVALVQAAHAAGKLAVAHVATEAEAKVAFDAHIDGLAHVFFDRVATPETIVQAKRSGAFVVATLTVVNSSAHAGGGASLADDPRIAPWLAASQAESLKATFGSKKNDFFTNATANVRLLHAAGVPILAGTDAGNPGTAHGASLHAEMAYLVAAGLSPVEALAAATSLPTRYFRIADRGRIAPGLRADLLLVDGDPTTDIEATRAIVTIWKNGVVVDRALTAAEKGGPGAPLAATDRLVSDFEDGTIAVRFGMNWSITTDSVVGGHSQATQAWQAGGADGSKGALRIAGTIDAQRPFAWAGSAFVVGGPTFDPIDLSQRAALVFKVRSESVAPVRRLAVLLYSGLAMQRMPAIVPFEPRAEWTEVRIPLSAFEGADLGRVRALAVVAQLPGGPFDFLVDDVRIE